MRSENFCCCVRNELERGLIRVLHAGVNGLSYHNCFLPRVLPERENHGGVLPHASLNHNRRYSDASRQQHDSGPLLGR